MVSILIAILGYSVQNISQASQKIGLLTMKQNRKKGLIIWGLATAGTGSSSLILLYSISIGQVSLVGAMAGTGLISMTIFASIFLKEKVGRKEIIGILLILIAAFLIGFFAVEISNFAIVLELLILKLVLVSLVYSILWVMFKKRHNILSVVLGGFAGAIGGFVSQFQKISTASSISGELVSKLESPLSNPEALINPYTFIWISLSITSMIILQFAHKTGRALRVIPAFAVNYILIPVIGGVTCFGEVLRGIQWFGIILILVGILFITIQKES